MNSLPDFQEIRQEPLNLDLNNLNAIDENHIKRGLKNNFINQDLKKDNLTNINDESNTEDYIDTVSKILKVDKNFSENCSNIDINIDKSWKENIQKKIKENIYLRKPFKEQKRLGRKVKSEENLGEHNKFSDDNILRKIKNVVLNNVYELINNKIALLSSNKLENAFSDEMLFKLKQNYLISSKAEYNKVFLNKTLLSIFSQDISTKYSKHPPDHNKEIIGKLLNDKDPDKREFFSGLFNLTFLEVLNHFRGTYYNDKLNGLKNFDDFCQEKNKNSLDEEYKKIFKFFLMNYEKEILTKKTRIRKDKKADE